jgi:hypothetical protein
MNIKRTSSAGNNHKSHAQSSKTMCYNIQTLNLTLNGAVTKRHFFVLKIVSRSKRQIPYFTALIGKILFTNYNFKTKFQSIFDTTILKNNLCNRLLKIYLLPSLELKRI